MGHHGLLTGVRQPAVSGRAVVGPGRVCVAPWSSGFSDSPPRLLSAAQQAIHRLRGGPRGPRRLRRHPRPGGPVRTLNVTFARPDERAKAFAVYSAIAASGAVLGLLLGGALTQWLSWRWCLYINLVFAIPAALAAVVLVRAPTIRPDRTRLDWPGVITAVGGNVLPRLRDCPAPKATAGAPR